MEKMTVYVAGHYERKAELLEIARLMELDGYEVVSSWLASPGDEPDLSGGPEAASEVALRDIIDLGRAEIFVLFTDDPETRRSRGGKDVEFGMAYHARKRVYVCGPRVNVFHYRPRVRWCPTLPLLLEALGVGEKVVELGDVS